MKHEFLTMTMLDIQRYLRRINAKLIRAKPVRWPKGEEAYSILYINL